ncbi:putative lipid II flippase FtsW [Alteribacter natronophilus]|uniref:putative lipid II flippase FtsW n=1 Tax=Alteribacter natronophilus TaxID=2583810 RepID=UPI001FE2DB8F|nr:putative lipid II flippase FtsW [Alteribacter natronophilus]
MELETPKKRLYIDWILVISVILLSLFGLLMVYSASYVIGYQEFGNFTHFFQRQLMWLGLSGVLFAWLMFFPYRHFRKLTPFIIFGSFILLALVVFTPLGHTVNGATRWVNFGPLRIQPSEFVKLGIIIYLAYIYSKKQGYIDNFTRGVLPPLVIVGLLFGLIMLQPDLGTATSIVVVAGFIVYCSGARFRHLFWIGGLGGVAIWYYANSEVYRLNRLIGHRAPFEDAYGEGYQLVQSYIAIAHGGLTGAGFGQSVQKLFYLPEAHTDFILAVVSEELGVLGILFVLGLITIIIVRGIIIGSRCRDAFGSLLAFGIVFQLAIQVVFNTGAVTGVLPITGIPFPLVSYGGSSLMVTLLSIGILANIARKTERDRVERMERNQDTEEEAETHPGASRLRPVRQFTR